MCFTKIWIELDWVKSNSRVRDDKSLCFFPCVLGAFDDEDIIHVEGNVDPVRDIEIIHEELRLKDEEMIAPIIDKLEKTAVRGGDKKLKPEYVSASAVHL